MMDMTQIWKEITQGLIGPNYVSFHPIVLMNKIFKDFQFVNQSEAIEAILDVGQGPSFVHFGQAVLENKIKM